MQIIKLSEDQRSGRVIFTRPFDRVDWLLPFWSERVYLSKQVDMLFRDLGGLLELREAYCCRARKVLIQRQFVNYQT
jgi:hypothetical protein